MAGMAFDLRRALLKKAEHESARLMDFEFRQRARTFKLMAEALRLDAAMVAALTARGDDEAALQELARTSGRDPAELAKLYAECGATARAGLIREIGDPTPYRLL